MTPSVIEASRAAAAATAVATGRPGLSIRSSTAPLRELRQTEQGKLLFCFALAYFQLARVGSSRALRFVREPCSPLAVLAPHRRWAHVLGKAQEGGARAPSLPSLSFTACRSEGSGVPLCSQGSHSPPLWVHSNLGRHNGQTGKLALVGHRPEGPKEEPSQAHRRGQS